LAKHLPAEKQPTVILSQNKEKRLILNHGILNIEEN
jgi:hypothetical protein